MENEHFKESWVAHIKQVTALEKLGCAFLSKMGDKIATNGDTEVYRDNTEGGWILFTKQDTALAQQAGALVSWLHAVVFSGITAPKSVSYYSSLALSFCSVYSLGINGLVTCLNMGEEQEEDGKRQLFLDEDCNFELKGPLQLTFLPVPDASLILDHGPPTSKPGM